jgi:5'-nucleotidase
VNTLPLSALTSLDDIVHLTILHTNDVHSRIEPFPDDGSRNSGQGGAAKRASLINSVRDEVDHMLLFDSGDIFQGTPYFNLFGGELEMRLMTQMGYDAGTMGNHDFDAGIDGFDKQLVHCDFPFIVSNYNFENTPLQGKIKPYKIWNIQDVRIGVYGLGIELDGLVPTTLYGETQYMDPIAAAQKYEAILKGDLKCDYVICLSHLGYRYRDNKVSDVILAQQTSFTDIILGGHTHTFMKEPHVETNAVGQPTFINQAGFAGIMMGRIDLTFEKNKSRKNLNSNNQIIR